jgi:NMD protein affecting ribosome stability and mRNA decay
MPWNPCPCRLCCLCGVQIAPNPTNMCVNCIRSQVDITEGIQKQVNILWCKMCGRYLQPPKHWLMAQPESKELLTFCIKRIKGMQKVRWLVKFALVRFGSGGRVGRQAGSRRRPRVPSRQNAEADQHLPLS